MDTAQLFKIFFEVVGGLGIFLLGMRYMSDSMQAVAGEKLRRMIGAITNNRIMACGVGVLVTCLIQSSSITTVMVVGMVNAGIMTLMQAIGVVLGANIGTTITGWILVLKIGKYGLPMIGIAAFFFLFSKKERVRYIAMLVLGLGMIFYGLMLMKNGFKPLRSMSWFTEWFHAFSPSTYLGVLKCCLVGAVLTAIVQSSSATLGITIGLATTGIIDYPTAAALVLGENIGTTITAFLASLGASTAAKRASYAHIFVNVFGVAWITSPLIFFAYISHVRGFMGVDPTFKIVGEGQMSVAQMTSCIAATHTGFNLINVAIILPFIGVVAKILEKIAPDKTYDEASHLTYLDTRMLQSAALSIEQSQKEVEHMGEVAETMLGDLRSFISNPDPEIKEKIFAAEKKLDYIQKEVAEFLTLALTQNLPQEAAMQVRGQLRLADEIETISDYVANILKLNLKINDTGEKLSQEGLNEVLELHDAVQSFLSHVNKSIKEGRRDVLPEAEVKTKAITHLMKDCRAKHLERVSQGKIPPLKSLAFTDILNSYRRINDHTFNMIEVQAGEK